MKSVFFIAVLCMTGFLSAQVKVPTLDSANISTDGNFTEKEWQSAQTIDIDKKVLLYFLQTTDHLFIGVRTIHGLPCYTDLYVKNDAVLNLHASMQLGERNITSSHWTAENPEWNWGNNTGWTANTVRFKPDVNESLPFETQILPSNGQEFKIEKSKLPKNPKIRIEVQSFIDAAVHFNYPLASKPFKPESWAEVIL